MWFTSEECMKCFWGNERFSSTTNVIDDEYFDMIPLLFWALAAQTPIIPSKVIINLNLLIWFFGKSRFIGVNIHLFSRMLIDGNIYRNNKILLQPKILITISSGSEPDHEMLSCLRAKLITGVIVFINVQNYCILILLYEISLIPALTRSFFMASLT